MGDVRATVHIYFDVNLVLWVAKPSETWGQLTPVFNPVLYFYTPVYFETPTVFKKAFIDPDRISEETSLEVNPGLTWN